MVCVRKHELPEARQQQERLAKLVKQRQANVFHV